MASVPEETIPAAVGEKKKPSAWKVLTTGFETLAGTVGFVFCAGAFLALMSGLVSNIKLSLSKWKAKAKLKQLERDAEQEDKKEKNTEKLQRREVKWKTLAEIHGGWD